MSDGVQRPGRTGSPDWQQMTKTERRKAAKAEAARAARARRRTRLITRVLAGVLAVAAITGIAWVVLRSDDPAGSGSGAASPDSTAASTAAFPPLPPGADPALARKPTVGPGSGEVTKLIATPLIQGQGPAAAAGQQITVNYVGVSFRTGAEFDASWNRSQPFTFQLGAGNVIQGWDQGLVGVRVGSRVQLDIPSRLAYGDNPGGGRPGGPLRFVVDVLALR